MQASPPSPLARVVSVFAGASDQLVQRTSLVVVRDLPPQAAERATRRASRALPTLKPDEPLYVPGGELWPQAGLLLRPGEEPITPAHWFVALVVALLRWAREPAWKGRVIARMPDATLVALPGERESVLRAAVTMADEFLRAWADPGLSPEAEVHLAEKLQRWTELARQRGLAPSTLRFALAAHHRAIPVSLTASFLRLGWGCRLIRMDSTFTEHTSNIAAGIAMQKFKSKQLLKSHGLPVPEGQSFGTWSEAEKACAQLGWPLVVKPVALDRGEGVVTRIRDTDTLREAFRAALKLCPSGVIVERHIEGSDHRMLVVGGRLWMVAQRTPGGVQGDGKHTIAALMDQLNAHPWRGTDKRSLLRTLAMDDEARQCLAEQALTAQSTPEPGRFVRLRRAANINMGGTATDVTPLVHPDNRIAAERAARLVGLDIAGVDFLCPDISKSWREVGGAICEVNAQPSLRVHWLSNWERDINGEILDWMFQDRPARIPTAAVTGTNGKSTTCRMLHHIWLQAGVRAGVTTTQGTWIGSDLISDDNLSGFPGGRLILEDPSTEAAVIEMPRKGLGVFGHPCDRYDVAALLNVQDDHLGEYGIGGLQQMAQVKASVLQRARRAVIVNAEDALCLAAGRRMASRRLVLVGRDPVSDPLREHVQGGGNAVTVQQIDHRDWIVACAGPKTTPVLPLDELVCTEGGLITANETNALFATALAVSLGLQIASIRSGLSSFRNSAEQNLGRYNRIPGFPFDVLLDYAHNPDGIRLLCEVARRWPSQGQRHAVCLTVGNRSASHIDACAPMLAAHFDRLVVGQDIARVNQCQDYAGSGPGSTMLQHFAERLRIAGLPTERASFQPDPREAITQAFGAALPGDLVVVMAEPAEAMPVFEELRTRFS